MYKYRQLALFNDLDKYLYNITFRIFINVMFNYATEFEYNFIDYLFNVSEVVSRAALLRFISFLFSVCFRLLCLLDFRCKCHWNSPTKYL